MVLYHAITMYHLLNVIVHKEANNNDAVLVIPVWIKEKCINFEYIYDIFEKVIIYDANYAFTKNDVEEYISQTVGDLSEFSNIYIWGAQFTLGYHLALNNIPFTFCEEGAGILSRPDVLMEIELRSPLKNKFCKQVKELGLYNGNNKCINQILCNVSAQADGFISSDKTYNFNVVNEFCHLESFKREKILNFFNGDACNIIITENSLVLLTQHFANLGVLSFDDQILIYQLFIDYFFGGKAFTIKPHPDDLMYYGQLFPEAQIIREKFPSEFIPFLFEPQPKQVATISSTAIYNLRESFDDVLELDTRYEKDFRFTHRYYAAVKLAQELGKNIICYAANEVLADRLSKTLDGARPTVFASMPEQYSNSIILVDDVTELGEDGRETVRCLLQGLPEDSCVLFINSKADYCWYDYEHKPLWNHILPVVLHKEAIEPKSEDFYASLEDEVIYLYSTDKETLTMAKAIEIEKNLPHTGITVTKQQFTAEQERIKVLEGILAATERRLLYYIEKEKGAK